MKKLLLFFIVSGLFMPVFSQDLVILKDGQKFKDCKIIKVDSANVYFKFEKNDRTINTFITKDKVMTYQYNYRNQHYPVNNYNYTDSANRPVPREIGSLGIGLGLDYGGLIGGNLLFYPQENIGLFAGVGYALAGIGFNAGIKLRLSKTRINPYITGMYGYNAAIKIIDASQYDKLFYGPTFGIGLDVRSPHPFSVGYFTCALLIPVRGQEVQDYINDLKNNHGIEFKTELIPIAFSLGFRIKF